MMNYDYIIVGGGTAGCVLAARLTENPTITVLLLEAGCKRRSPLLSIPAGEILLMNNPKYDWRFVTQPDSTVHNRCLQIPRGRLLGGSNMINGMIFVRGQPEDYNEWADEGNQGWSWNDVLPYFRRLETTLEFNSVERGQQGPVCVALPRERDKLCDAFITAAVQNGYLINSDYNAGQQEGFGYYQVTQRQGKRSSVLSAYLKKTPKNLTIISGAHVTKLRLQNKRCIGVDYQHAKIDYQVNCRREVILSAGVIQSPQLLELSGIGNADILQKYGIPVHHHLPGVGENFRDHFATRMRWRIRQPITFNERTRGLRFLREIIRYTCVRRGVLSLPIALGFGFVRSSPSESRPDIQFHFAPASYGQSASRRLDSLPGITLGIYPLRPKSSGSVHICSQDPFVFPAITSRFLQDPQDCRRLVEGMRIARQIISSTSLDAYRKFELLPGAEVNSTDDLLTFARAHGDTSYHPIGTCRMGNGPAAVVDHRLRVHGVEGLRVIDASIMPGMVSGNTNAATLMIAEKGAAMLIEDHPQR